MKFAPGFSPCCPHTCIYKTLQLVQNNMQHWAHLQWKRSKSYKIYRLEVWEIVESCGVIVRYLYSVLLILPPKRNTIRPYHVHQNNSYLHTKSANILVCISAYMIINYQARVKFRRELSCFYHVCRSCIRLWYS